MRNKAFTLIEILVVISIIVILSGIVLVNYRVGERQFALQGAAVKLASDIRRAQEMAVASEECQKCGGGIPEGGYGILLNENSPDHYIIYADEGNKYFWIGDSTVEVIYLEKGVRLKDVQLLQPPGNPTHISINFTPPDPEINITGSVGEMTGDEAIITIALEAEPSKIKTITVNKAGRIDID